MGSATDPIQAKLARQGPPTNTPQSLHLHMVTDATDETLSPIAKAVRAQYAHIHTIEHAYPPVRSLRQLDGVLKEIEATSGIVLYSLSDQKLAEALEQFCQRLEVPYIAARNPSRPSKNRTRKWLRYIMLSALAVFLAWQVITRSLGAYWAEVDPEMALRLPSTIPTALVNLAANELVVGGDNSRTQFSEADPDGNDQDEPQHTDREGDPESQAATEASSADADKQSELRTWLKSALRKDPLNARAFRLLGQVKYRDNDEKQTTRFMQAAARRSLHESNATHWMMRESYEKGDFETALRYADVLLRDRPDAAPEVMPILGRIAEDERASGRLGEVLATNPIWRSRFFDLLPRHISDARTPLNIVLSLKDSPNPPRPSDLKNYLNFLVSQGFQDLAYYAWLQFLPASELSRIGLLFNGSFELEPAGLPFDWTFKSGGNVTIKRAKRLDKEQDHALLLDFGSGRVNTLSVTQLVVLPPGAYRFEGEYLAEIKSARGLQWRVSCQGKKDTLLGESIPVVQGSDAAWKSFGFSFTVPGVDCPAQRIELFFTARWASEQFISGAVWYDNLRIERERSASN